jgi:hypothetical protein
MGVPMDDFKTSTRAMLEVVRSEKARLKKRMQELDEREAIILKWIEQEEGPQQRELPMTGAKPLIHPRRLTRPSLSDFLLEVMSDGRPRSNAELGEVAKLRGILDEDANLRSIHSTMLSLANSGAFVRRDEKWIRTVKPIDEKGA